MTEQQFYQAIQQKAKELHINPLLLISGMEGLYSFKDVPVNSINFEFLDCLILTIFALRIGDQFHLIAEENLKSPNSEIKAAALAELSELTETDIKYSSNSFLQSFAHVLNGKSTIRRYHEKALEVAALEIRKAQEEFGERHIGTIMLAICKNELNGTIDLSAFFGQ